MTGKEKGCSLIDFSGRFVFAGVFVIMLTIAGTFLAVFRDPHEKFELFVENYRKAQCNMDDMVGNASDNTEITATNSTLFKTCTQTSSFPIEVMYRWIMIVECISTGLFALMVALVADKLALQVPYNQVQSDLQTVVDISFLGYVLVTTLLHMVITLSPLSLFALLLLDAMHIYAISVCVTPLRSSSHELHPVDSAEAQFTDKLDLMRSNPEVLMSILIFGGLVSSTTIIASANGICQALFSACWSTLALFLVFAHLYDYPDVTMHTTLNAKVWYVIFSIVASLMQYGLWGFCAEVVDVVSE